MWRALGGADSMGEEEKAAIRIMDNRIAASLAYRAVAGFCT